MLLHETLRPHTLSLTPPSARYLQPVWHNMVISALFGALTTIALPTPALAERWAGGQTPVGKGVLLVAHPSMEDPNFRHTVVLIVDHGPEGTIGFVLNRPTDIPLSQALPGLAGVKETSHRLFIGGPVSPTRLTMVARLTEPLPDLQPIVDNIYMGGTPAILERLLTKPKPTEAFRMFAGMAGWAPGQLAFELGQGAWALLSPDAAAIFDKDPVTLWSDSLQRLQTPMVISQ